MPEITPPIACTLDPAQMPQRGDEIRALGRDGLEAVERGERHATLRFRPDRAIRDRVERIVAAESRCCAFLDLTLADADDATVLTIAAPEGGEATMHELANLFAAGSGRAC
jgi:hypothetical protein